MHPKKLSQKASSTQECVDILTGVMQMFYAHGERFPWSHLDQKMQRDLAKTHPSAMDTVRKQNLHYSDMGVSIKDLDYDWSAPMENTFSVDGLQPLPDSLVRTVLDGEDTTSLAETFSGVDADGALSAGTRLAMDSYEAVLRWMNGGRRLVQPTRRAVEELLQVEPALERLYSLNGIDPWKRGYMIEMPDWNSVSFLKQEEGTWLSGADCERFIFYVEPVETAFGMGIRIYGWGKTDPLSKEERMRAAVMGIPKRETEAHWSPITFREWVEGEDRMEPTFNGSIEFDPFTIQNAKKMGVLADGTRFSMEVVRRVCINALCALLSEPDIIAVDRPKRKNRRRRTSTMGGTRGIKRLTLSEDCTRMVMTRWKREATEQRESSTRTVGLHHVDPFMRRTWVNRPLPHENVMETRDKTTKDGTTKTQYRVMRRVGGKGGFARGSGPLRAKRAAIVTGIDDA